MALPNTNITTSLVKTTIGASTNNVGALCKHPNINKWSKWKPVRFNKVSGLTDLDIKNINYGIDYVSFSSIENIRTAYNLNQTILSYNKPRGNTIFPAEPYRLGDFRNYEHNAVDPIVGISVTSSASNIKGGQNTISGTLIFNGNPKPGEISLSDLGLSTRRLGIALFNSDGDIVRSAVANNSGGTSVSIDTLIPAPKIPTGFYLAILFFTNTSGGTTSDLRAIPNHDRIGYPVEVTDNQVYVGIGARWDPLNRDTIIYNVSGYNTTGSPVTLLNCQLRFRSSKNQCSSTIQQYEVLRNLGTLTVPHSTIYGTTLYEGTETVYRDGFMGWKICWSSGGAYPQTLEAAIIQEMD